MDVVFEAIIAVAASIAESDRCDKDSSSSSCGGGGGGSSSSISSSSSSGGGSSSSNKCTLFNRAVGSYGRRN